MQLLNLEITKMGSNFATDLADNDTLTLERSIAIQLTSNHYPPVPLSMVEPCIEAIQAWNEDYDSDRLIKLPDGVSWRDKDSAPAWAIIEAHHLDAWCVHAWDCDCNDCNEGREE